MGDLAILVPFLSQLRRAIPSAHISLLVNAGLVGFLEGQGLVDEFIPIRVPWAQHFSRWKKYNPFSPLWLPFLRVLSRIREKNFDLVFSGRMDIRDNLLMWLTGAPRRIGYGVGGGGFLLTDRVVPNLDKPHRSDVWLHLLSEVGIDVQENRHQFRLLSNEEAAAEEYLRSRGIYPGTFLVAVHPGARIPVRRWGDERFAAVAQELLRDKDLHVFWFVEPNSTTIPHQHERCHLVALEFRSFLAVLKRCRLLICNDSGPMHVASLLNVPVVAVFGSTNPVWFGPRGPKDRIVIRPEMCCRPCFDYCIFDQPYCLRLIKAEEVLYSAEQLVAEVKKEALLARS
jgi:ADP-heptose:LPS heptosyltransferase